jgi:hypothetical protein
MPILGCVKITQAEGFLVMEATDLEVVRLNRRCEMAKRMVAKGKLKGKRGPTMIEVIVALEKALCRYTAEDWCALTAEHEQLDACDCDFCVGTRALTLADKKRR